MVGILRAKTCTTCTYRFKNGNEIQCRANPPINTPVIGPGPQGRPVVVANVTSFPIVSDEWWCGHWSGLQKPDILNEMPAGLQA